jgi:hypothetical protein
MSFPVYDRGTQTDEMVTSRRFKRVMLIAIAQSAHCAGGDPEAAGAARGENSKQKERITARCRNCTDGTVKPRVSFCIQFDRRRVVE